MPTKIRNPAGRVMAETIPVRLHPSDKQLLSLAARDAGMPVSTFLRHEAIEAARKRLLKGKQ